MFAGFKHRYKKLLEFIVIFLMIVLTLIVVLGVIYRKMHMSLSWYDEVASVLLAWLTYYGAALAALNREHIGFNGLINAMKPAIRMPFVVISEVFIIGFFVLLAWVGVLVLQVLEGDALTSLTWVPTRLTQSVIPIGATLFVLSELLSFPDLWKMARSTGGVADHDAVEIPKEDANLLDSIKEEMIK